MKRILLLSDTHSYLDPAILTYAETVDEIWHAGDIGNVSITDALRAVKPLRAVFGNIDGTELRKELPENDVFFCEEMKVYMTHIGGYPGKYPQRIKEIFELEKPQIFVCGHSHILKVMYDKKFELLAMNPGAMGKSGFHQKRTMLRFEVDKDEVKNLEVIEFNK